MKYLRKNDCIMLVFSVVLFAVLQLLITERILSSFWQLNLLIIGINIILAASLNLINGYTGQFSLGHAGFMAVGAYVGVVLTANFHMPFAVALIAGGAACEAQIFSVPSLRLTARVETPGLCAGAVWTGTALCTFSMTEQAAGVLCLHDAQGFIRSRREIPALPGGLCADARGVWALYWGGATYVQAGENRQTTLRLDGLNERAAILPGGTIFCQPSTPRCVLVTSRGVQTLRGGSDVCVYETN